jgi:hypothetical protein
MPSSSSDNSADSGRSFFDHPRQAPLPPMPASRSARSTPEGFVLPVVPLVNDPLIVTRDAHGHHQLPHVSDSPLGVDDGRVMRLVQYHPMVRALYFLAYQPLLNFSCFSFRLFLNALIAPRWVSLAPSPRLASPVLLALSSASRIATGPIHFGSSRTSSAAATYTSLTNETSL